MKTLILFITLFIGLCVNAQVPSVGFFMYQTDTTTTGGGGGGDTELLTDLLSVWEFDETSGTTVYDSFGSNNGTNTGADVNQAGIVNNSYLFTLGDYINLGSFNANTSTMSAFCWVKTTKTSAQIIVCKYDYGAGARSWSLNMTASGQLQVYASNDGSSGTGHFKSYYTSSSINDGSWHHVGFTFDSGTLLVYIDGSEATVTKSRDDAITTIYQSSVNNIVGAQYNNGSLTISYVGNIDQLGIWDRALTTGDISNLASILPYTSW